MNRSCAVAIVIVLMTVAAASQISAAPSSTAGSSPRVPKPEVSPGYVGDAACPSCHQEKVETFHRTSHYLTSRLPEKDSILGSFAADANVMKTSNPELFFRMEQKGDDFFQTAVEGTDP